MNGIPTTFVDRIRAAAGAMLRKTLSLGCLAFLGCNLGPLAPRLPGSWTEADLCDSRAPLSLVILDPRGSPLANAEVWTEARMRMGGEGMGEVSASDVIMRGRMMRSDAHGRVHACDVTTPLVREYGTKGWSANDWVGRSWRSLMAVDLFIEIDGQYVRVARFASRSFGTGTLFEPPTTVVFSAPKALVRGQRPIVARPSDQ